MRRIAFIIPYFGKFNEYFPLWIKSCSYNSDIADFIIITDIPYSQEIPNNVKFIHYTWAELVKHIQSFYDFPIALNSPYGLCDYKCAYGEIFNYLIKNYSHWAYGDNDLIWGKWSDLLPSDWESYDKIGNYGHLTIVKNTNEMNTLYRYNDAYKIAFTDSRNLFFDENGFNLINACHNKKTYSLKIADCNPRVRKLTPINPLKDSKSGLFIWEQGNLFHVSENNGKIYKESIMYIHFLKRKMNIHSANYQNNCYIIHDILIIGEKDSSILNLHQLINKNTKSKFYFEYWRKYLSIYQLIKTFSAKINPVKIKIEQIKSLILMYYD